MLHRAQPCDCGGSVRLPPVGRRRVALSHNGAVKPSCRPGKYVAAGEGLRDQREDAGVARSLPYGRYAASVRLSHVGVIPLTSTLGTAQCEAPYVDRLRFYLQQRFSPTAAPVDRCRPTRLVLSVLKPSAWLCERTLRRIRICKALHRLSCARFGSRRRLLQACVVEHSTFTSSSPRRVGWSPAA
jgi:hypothetical protein